MTSANSAAPLLVTTTTATTTGASISDVRSRPQIPQQRTTHFRSRSYPPAPARSSACASMACTTTDTTQHFSLPAHLAAPGFSSPVVPAVAFPSNWPPQHAWVPVAWWNAASGHVLVATEEGWRLLLQQMADESPPPRTTTADGENQGHEEPQHPTSHHLPQQQQQGEDSGENQSHVGQHGYDYQQQQEEEEDKNEQEDRPTQ